MRTSGQRKGRRRALTRAGAEKLSRRDSAGRGSRTGAPPPIEPELNVRTSELVIGDRAHKGKGAGEKLPDRLALRPTDGPTRPLYGLRVTYEPSPAPGAVFAGSAPLDRGETGTLVLPPSRNRIGENQ
ncbi:hypothetical protein GCM10010402_20050 [Actinomadura luteofluorescens]